MFWFGKRISRQKGSCWLLHKEDILVTSSICKMISACVVLAFILQAIKLSHVNIIHQVFAVLIAGVTFLLFGVRMEGSVSTCEWHFVIYFWAMTLFNQVVYAQIKKMWEITFLFLIRCQKWPYMPSEMLLKDYSLIFSLWRDHSWCLLPLMGLHMTFNGFLIISMSKNRK